MYTWEAKFTDGQTLSGEDGGYRGAALKHGAPEWISVNYSGSKVLTNLVTKKIQVTPANGDAYTRDIPDTDIKGTTVFARIVQAFYYGQTTPMGQQSVTFVGIVFADGTKMVEGLYPDGSVKEADKADFTV